MKNIVGAPATGDNFFYRESEIKKIVDRINAGNNLQIAAPRRVGKTSILHYLKDIRAGGHIYVYVDTERIDDEQLFYKKLLKGIFGNELISNSKPLFNLVKQRVKFFNKVKSIKVFGAGLEFSDDNKEADYYEEITNFLSGLELEANQKLVLLIDEFPQTILNIVDANKGDTAHAIQFLQSNRELRINPNILNKVHFIYTGSIGLNHTVTSINASAFVNDLNSTDVDPLSREESQELIGMLCKDKNISIEKDAIAHLLDKINWLIPFHIQLAIQEIGTLCRLEKNANVNTINAAFELMVERRNHNHFEHYYSRLRRQFKGKALEFAEFVLHRVAIEGSISKGDIYNQAVALKINQHWREIIDILCYDGYINNNGNANAYKLNSPLVGLWWQKFICN